MNFFTNLTKNAEEVAQGKEKDAVEENVSRSKLIREDQRRGFRSHESNDLHVEYVPTEDQQRSYSGLLVTGLSHIKPVLLGSPSDSDTEFANQTFLRILEILGQRKNLNIIDQQQQHQQQQHHPHKIKRRHQKHPEQLMRGKDGLTDPVPLRKSSEIPDSEKVPPSAITTYVSKLLAKPKLRDDLLRRVSETMGMKGISKTNVEDALRQILSESSKADRDLQRQRSGTSKATQNQSSFHKAGSGYRLKGQRGETVGTAGTVNELSVVGDQIYSGTTLHDPDDATILNDPDQNLASSGPGRTSPTSESHASRRYSAGRTSEGRQRHRRTSRRESSRERRRSSKGKDAKKRKSSAAKDADRLQKTTEDERKTSGSGSEATPVDEDLLLRLSKGAVLKGDEDKAGTAQGKSDDMRINAPSALTKGVASDLSEKRPASSPPKGPTSGDLLGPAARSPTTKDGAVSAAPPSQDRWADAVGKNAGAVTMATSAGGPSTSAGGPSTSEGGAGPGTGLTNGVGVGKKDGPGKRPSSSPVKRVGKGTARNSQLRQTASAKTSKTGDLQKHDDPENQLHSDRDDDESKDKDGDTRKGQVQGGSGRGRDDNNMSMQSSSANHPPPPPPWTGPANDGETKGGRAAAPVLKTRHPGSDTAAEHGSRHAVHRGPDSAFVQGIGSDADNAGQGSKKEFATGGIAHRVSVAARQDGESHIQGSDEGLAQFPVEVGRIEVPIETWSLSPPMIQTSPVVPSPLFLARGDNYGLPGKGYELTRAFVFSYTRRMPPHYIDFKNNPPIFAAKKKKTNNKRKN